MPPALDALWEAEAANLGQMVRYADDLVVLCRTQARAEAAHRWIVATLMSGSMRGGWERIVCEG